MAGKRSAAVLTVTKCRSIIKFYLLNYLCMKQVCKFRQGADILATQSGLATSIPDAIDYGRIKDTSVPSSYNGQKSLQEVGQRIGEPFDIIEFDRTYTKVRKSINDAEFERTKDKVKDKK